MFYLNGNYLNDPANAINIADRGFLLGDGVFTTIKAQNGSLIHFEKHMERLKHDTEKIYLKCNLNKNKLHEICLNILKSNNLEKNPAIIRITYTRGVSGRGINISEESNPTLLIRAVPYNDSMALFPRICTTTIQKNEKSIISGIKSLNYLESILARHEAINKGYDDGIMFNTQSNITECSVANIFFINKNDEIITPPISDGILPGIVRSEILKICKGINIPIFEESINLNKAINCKATFITNCAIGIKIIKSINDTIFTYKHELIEKINNSYTSLINCNG